MISITKAAVSSIFAVGALLGAASAKPIPAEAFSKPADVTGLSMSLEGDMIVGLVADPSQDGEALAAAYWDLSGEIDTSKPLPPTAVTPSDRSRFYGANALKQKKSLWFTAQPFVGALDGSTARHIDWHCSAWQKSLSQQRIE